jgi:hypothetical protein
MFMPALSPFLGVSHTGFAARIEGEFSSRSPLRPFPGFAAPRFAA